MTTVTENVDLPGGVDPTGVVGTLEIVGASGDPIREVYDQTGAKTIAGFYQFTLSSSATWSVSLTGNSSITPAGTVYRRTLTGREIPSSFEYGTVPSSGGPYRWDQILTDAPASVTDSALSAHAGSITLHGGGQELAFAGLSANFTTSSTSYVDITGLSITFTAPSRPFVIEAWMSLLVEEAGRTTDIQMLQGTTVITADSVKSVSSNQAMSFHMRARLPTNVQTPTAGSSYTYRLQMKSSQTSNDSSIFVNFISPINVAYLQAYTC